MVGIKLCTKCKKELPATIDYFYKQIHGENGLKASCKKCDTKESYKWKLKNPERAMIIRQRATKKRRCKLYGKWKEIVKARSMDKCSKCGYDRCFAAIHFHHINPMEKTNIMSILFNHVPTEKRIKELDKCIPLCSNCHIEVHNK